MQVPNYYWHELTTSRININTNKSQWHCCNQEFDLDLLNYLGCILPIFLEQWNNRYYILYYISSSHDSSLISIEESSASLSCKLDLHSIHLYHSLLICSRHCSCLWNLINHQIFSPIYFFPLSFLTLSSWKRKQSYCWPKIVVFFILPVKKNQK